MSSSKALRREIYNEKKLLGIDYGTKFTGLATFHVGMDPYPTPFLSYPMKNEIDLINKIISVCHDEAIDLIVVGLPLYLDGNESEMTKKVKDFAERLGNNTAPIEILLQDETLTSYEAESRMKNSPQYNFKVDKKKVDSIAAAIILEDFIKG